MIENKKIYISDKGITIVSLVITIIVLLILSGIALVMALRWWWNYITDAKYRCNTRTGQCTRTAWCNNIRGKTKK